MNAIVVTGNLAYDPELKFTPTGKTVVQMTVMENRSRRTDQGWEDLPPNVYRVEAWGDLASNVAESCRKGDRVTVVGAIVTDRWSDKETGEPRTAQHVRADEVAFSLRYHTVVAHKNPKMADQGPSFPQDAPPTEPSVDPWQ